MIFEKAILNGFEIWMDPEEKKELDTTLAVARMLDIDFEVDALMGFSSLYVNFNIEGNNKVSLLLEYRAQYYNGEHNAEVVDIRLFGMGFREDSYELRDSKEIFKALRDKINEGVILNGK